jgi:chemotaxis signal transduction protein
VSQELTLMVVAAPVVELGIDAALVLEVIPFDRWSGTASQALQERMGAVVEGARRILLVARQGREPLALEVSGAVRLRQVERSAALELPELLAPHARWISHVIMTDGQLPLLVVDPEQLG